MKTGDSLVVGTMEGGVVEGQPIVSPVDGKQGTKFRIRGGGGSLEMEAGEESIFGIRGGTEKKKREFAEGNWGGCRKSERYRRACERDGDSGGCRVSVRGGGGGGGGGGEWLSSVSYVVHMPFLV